MSVQVTEYTDLGKTKTTLNLSDNTEHDDKLLDIIFDANQEIDNVLLPFAEKIPLPADDDLYPKGEKLVTSFIKVLWAINNFQMELQKEYKEIYNEKRINLIETLKASRTNRTKRASVGTNYRTRRMFSQIKRY